MMLFAALRERRAGRPRLAGANLGSVLPLAAGRRLLGLVVLAAALALTTAALAGSGGELPGRGLALAGQLASAAAGLLVGETDDCPSDGWLLPLPVPRDESFPPADLQPPSWSCDQPEVEPPG